MCLIELMSCMTSAGSGGSVPVAFQWASADAARLLMIAGPAWLGWIAATSFGMLRTES